MDLTEKSRRVPEKILLGPGPTPVEGRILRAMAEPTLGHLDRDFVAIMDETRDLLRMVFQTGNDLTVAMSGTGSAGMETACVNMIERGDKAIICSHGVFGSRMQDVAGRCGAEVVEVNAPMGRPIDPGDVERAVKANPDAKFLGIVHAETSTGVLQPLDEIANLAHMAGMFMIVDAVTSLGGMEVPVDRLGLDMVYSGSQKCLGCPPGLAPVTVGPRAVEHIKGRKTKVQSWYLDLTMIMRYWGQERFYHHTAPVNMIYGLNEGLRVIAEEGLEARFARHRKNAESLWAGLEALGLELLVEPAYRLPSLTSVRMPVGVDEAVVRGRLMEEYSIEVGSGLGDLKGKIIRIGLMGSGSSRKNVVLLLSALGAVLSGEGFANDVGAAIEEALAVIDG
ncbi:MAG: Purine catabolism protein PucG [Synergistetes bacterium ADurb.Bin155]|jgi:alanine-glyoxylate transaminase/serine-glyoxylate transaminase/serine-pyruvate transaminase|nr:alanine--glyoxylate aminotransferase family protein [Synergistales bacterium]OQB44832.1 MAG: Purine catabolism protein PucG [Synergistetes bacterium ADurb.Bin155]HOC81390.1 alanine--glyoxylate aminotransferase family protein [Synergistales bacterium]HQL01897.1 alanine--glyoxylate aminotransferase family protein [Synergistales bacterium]